MSLKDIAEKAGTSVSTVSKVLNDTYGSCASARLKEKIWAAAHETGYVPNKNARNLKKGINDGEKTGNIFLVMARSESIDTDLFFKELYRQLEIALFGQGLTLKKTVYSRDISKTDFTSCDGIIVMGRGTPKLLKTLKGYTENIVGIWRNPMDYEIDEIVCDGRKAAAQAVMYLIGLGHKNIGYIGDCSYESRYVGYSETMISEKLAINYNYIVHTDQSRQKGKEAMEKLLLQEDLSAVLCANDMTALGALEALSAQKKKDGRRISVISIDDIEQAQETKPLLTTVHIPSDDMAHMAAVVLKDRIARPRSRQLRVEFPCRITVRESCFAPDQQ